MSERNRGPGTWPAGAGTPGQAGTYRMRSGAARAWMPAVCAGLIVLGTVPGAGAAVNPDTDRLGRISQYAEPKGPVKRVHVQDYVFRLPLGIPVPVRWYTEREDDYDRQGHLVHREHIYSHGGSSVLSNAMVLDYVYDGAGNCTTEICRYNDMRPAYVSRSTYDEAGRLLEKARTDQTGEISYRFICDYDEAGHKLSETTHTRDGMLHSRRTFAYDRAGRLAESFTYDPEGRLMSKDVYRYDAQGRETARRSTDAQGNDLWTTRTTYDENDVVRRSVNSTDTGTQVTVYNERGDVTAEALYSPDKGERLVRLVRLYAYDEHGNATVCLELRTSLIVLGRQILVPYCALVSSFEYYEAEEEAATDHTDGH